MRDIKNQILDEATMRYCSACFKKRETNYKNVSTQVIIVYENVPKFLNQFPFFLSWKEKNYYGILLDLFLFFFIQNVLWGSVV